MFERKKIVEKDDLWLAFMQVIILCGMVIKNWLAVSNEVRHLPSQ
jgi:hypothetical protein